MSSDAKVSGSLLLMGGVVGGFVLGYTLSTASTYKKRNTDEWVYIIYFVIL